MGLPARQDEPVYLFGEFRLEVAERRLMAGDTTVELEPKALEMLTVLVSNAGRLVSRSELLEILWPDTFVEEGNINAYASVIRKALGDTPKLALFIETVPKAGYRFVADVREMPGGDRSAPLPGSRPHRAIAAVGDSNLEHPTSTRVPERSAPRYGAYMTAWSLLYALLFVVALFVELAYSYQQLGHIAWSLAPWIFAWISVTSIVGLYADLELTRRGHAFGLLVSIPVFVLAGFGTAVCVGPWLPSEAITRASFQTYTAQAAYIKSAYYFVPLAVLYVVLPFHLVVALDIEVKCGRAGQVMKLLSGGRPKPAPRGAVHLRVWWLAMLLVFVAAVSVYGTAHLFDRLVPDASANLFMRLYQVRLVLFFLLGSTGLIWLQLSFDRLRRETRMELR